jgi:hypothetical protein
LSVSNLSDFFTCIKVMDISETSNFFCSGEKSNKKSSIFVILSFVFHYNLTKMIIKILNLVMLGLMILMNYLANALPINGKTTGALSAQYPNLFVPAGITFSIWGVIYLLLLVFAILQFRETNGEIIQSIGWLFAFSCLFNGLWIIAWHYEKLPLSLLLMAGLLISLVLINMKISPLPHGLIKAAFGVYLGWICIASIANVTALLVFYNWNGWGISEEIWTIVMITIGMVITIATILKMHNPYIGLAVMWAFLGIILKQQSDYLSIAIAAFTGIVCVLSSALFRVKNVMCHIMNRLG